MHGLVQLATRKWLEAHGQLEKWKQQFIRNLDAELPTGEYENWAKCQAAFPTRAISNSTAARGARLIKRLGFNTIQGSMVCMENGERGEAEKMSVQAMKARKKDSWSRAQRYAEQYGNGRLGV